MKLWNKLPRVREMLDVIEELKAEVAARDEFGEQLIEENEKLAKDRTELITKLNKARDEFDAYREKAEVNLKAERDGAEMWHKRWQDEHEKYLDLCDQLRGAMETMKGALENVLAHTTIDT